MDLHCFMEAIAAAFMDPLRGAIDGVADVGLPIVHAAIPLVGGSRLSARGRGRMPHGALIQWFPELWISIAALSFWPRHHPRHDGSDRPDLRSGHRWRRITDPFEVATAGGALAVLAFEHASAIVGYFDGWVMGALLILTGALILVAYALISALSVMAWLEFLGAAVSLAR